MKTTELDPRSITAAGETIPENTPFVMLNLVRYKKQADYGGRTDLGDRSGREAYYQGYIKAWSAISDGERKQLVEYSLSSDFHYIDPRVECHGHEEIISNIESFQQRYPGGSFTVKIILSHHDVALVNWQLIEKDGTAGILGFDMVRFNQSGLIADITGFFVPPPV